jgi:spore coat protein U-like protein
MKNLHRLLLGWALLLAALPAWSLTCSLTTNPAPVKLTYSGGALTATGKINLTCMRDPLDKNQVNLWIGMVQTTAGRNAPGDMSPVATMNYEVFHATQANGTWTDTGIPVSGGSTTNGPVADKKNFNSGNNLNFSYDFYLRVPGQGNKPAGVYADSLPITVKDTDGNGTVITTGSLDVYISVPKSCRFSTPATPIDVNYTAFSTVAVTGTSNLTITCTDTTLYFLSLDKTRSVVPTVGLAYGLTLNGAGLQRGSAMPQAYSVDISIDPGQAGQCSLSACTGTDVRTLTVLY